MISAADFLSVYPKFQKINETEPAKIAEIVAAAVNRCPSRAWCDPERQRRAMLLYAAHLAEIDLQQTAVTAGIATTIASGQSVGIGQGSMSVDQFLDQTAYGREFRHLSVRLPTTTGFVV
jgi:hypothetical protein